MDKILDKLESLGQNRDEVISSLLKELELENCIGEVENKGEQMPIRFKFTYKYTDQSGQTATKYIYATNRTEADKKFQQYIEDLKHVDSITFREFIYDVYYPRFLPKKLSTQTTYKVFIERYILPNIGDKMIDAVDVTDIQRLMDWMANGKVNGLSKNMTEGTISRVKGLISHLYNIAVDMHLANENPVKVTLLVNKGVESSHHTALLDEEFESVKKKIPLLESLDDRVLMGLIAYTGMRPEEVRGIMWDDINMDGRYVIVKRAVTYVGRDHYAHVDTPKSETSQRTVYIPAPLFSILSSVPDTERNGFVVHADKDKTKPIPEKTWQRTINRIFTFLGIKGKYSPHDFRATYATMFKESGMTSAQVADLLGHADTRMVETIYARNRHQSIMKQGRAIESMFSNSGLH